MGVFESGWRMRLNGALQQVVKDPCFCSLLATRIDIERKVEQLGDVLAGD